MMSEFRGKEGTSKIRTLFMDAPFKLNNKSTLAAKRYTNLPPYDMKQGFLRQHNAQSHVNALGF